MNDTCTKQEKTKTILVAMDDSQSIRHLQGALPSIGVTSKIVMRADLHRALAKHPSCDMLIVESNDDHPSIQGIIEAREGCECPLLVLVPEDRLDEMASLAVKSFDFIVKGASKGEWLARIHRLLALRDNKPDADVITIDTMTINFATYQVSVGGKPIDFTYLEYALLSFLVAHAGRTFTRDVLLKQVWGFDFSCGSRTVDVHVRRVRAKLGPELSQRLETVRGVGYLWNS